MKKIYMMICLIFSTFAFVNAKAAKLNVVTTLPDYASIAKAIGGDRVSVKSIVQGKQDAHFIRPKPSFVEMVRQADVLIDTGLDLEMWLPTVIDKSGNKKIRSGGPGYISASQNMKLLEKPKLLSRSEGGLHIYGNPHVTCSPINMRVAARNIASGLIRNDPEGKAFYEKNLKAFINEIDIHLFGKKLVDMLGGDTLCELAQKDKLIPFLKKNKYKDKYLIDYLGGWMAELMPLRGKPIITYHKNWVYFTRLFGLNSMGTIEPKPGIPPSSKHVLEVEKIMKDNNIKIILAASYFDEHKIKRIAEKVGAMPVIVSVYVGGDKGVNNYFQLVDKWITELLNAAKKERVIK